jgi:putative transposase of IS4/5 family DUF4096
VKRPLRSAEIAAPTGVGGFCATDAPHYSETSGLSASLTYPRSICVLGKLPKNRLPGHSHEHLDANQLLNGWQTGSTLPNFRQRVMLECPHCINTGMRHTRDLTDGQWKTLDPLIPKAMKREDGRGRPWKSRRSVLNGVPWVLRTGSPWADLPDR